MLDELQKKAAQAIVNIFETGRVQGEYGKVTLLPGDTGHLTYGRSQTTLASGNLYLLIKAYCDRADAEFAAPLRSYLDRLANRDISLDNNLRFRSLLREAGEDIVMHEVQDEFFDRVYWEPSLREAGRIAVDTGLAINVVYDSRIHGSWARMRDRTNRRHGMARNIGEHAWIGHYVQERHDWLANHSNPLLQKTVYRMVTFRQLIDASNWRLALPLRVRGVLIDEETLLATAPVRVTAHDEQEEEERLLRLQSPYMRGNDVRSVQQALANAGIAVSVDGTFGPRTEVAVKEFQRRQGLTVDGIVGPATRSALGL